MKVKATVVCENYVMWDRRLMGEHGFSVFLETDHGNYLFDTGTGKTIINNSVMLGLDLKSINGIILSHNHGDHTGGLMPVLDVKEGIEIYSHPSLFVEAYSDDYTEYNYIGIPYSRAVIENRKVKFNFSTEYREITRGLWLTGEVPRVTEFERAYLSEIEDHCQVIKTDNGYEKNIVKDDQSIVIDTKKGLMVILGCCHSGIINTLSYVAGKMGTRHFYAVIGGTHLASLNEETKEKTIKSLCEFDIENLGISHCSGLEILVPLTKMFHEKVFYCHVGKCLEV